MQPRTLVDRHTGFCWHGTTRTLAKTANNYAKKGTGTFRLDAKTPHAQECLGAIPVGEIWGIGRHSAEKLHRYGICTARHLCDADDQLVRRLLTVVGLRTKRELCGTSCIVEDDMPVTRKTLISTRSFGKRVTCKKHLAEALAMHATKVAERLRKENLEAKAIAIHIRTARHSTGAPYSKSAEATLPLPTSVTSDFIKATAHLLDSIFEPGHKYAKVGVTLFDIAPPGNQQKSLFDLIEPKAREAKATLMRTMDSLNHRFGKGMVCYAAQGPSKADWHMQRLKKSPEWTTKWDELATVR